MTESDKPVVAIAGATGFVGRAVRLALVQDHTVVGLTRSPTRASLPDEDGVLWRHCDLFSLVELETALEGVDYAIYLVHSMLPSARLVQADFVDLDLILADNFARAAEKNGVSQILYLGGIQPREGELSRHLRSRLEVEATLAARSCPVTALRAGLVVGPGGSSLSMLVNLVRRLPVMLLPKWADSKSAPIAIEDVVRAVRRCVGDPEAYGQAYEIGGPKNLTYREMLISTAEALGKHPPLIGLPVFSPALSRKWISMVSGAPDALVGPLIESLHHSMEPAENPLQNWLKKDGVPFEEALRKSIDAQGRPLPNPRRQIRPGDQNVLQQARTVRSVQRLPLPNNIRATWVAQEYMRWLPLFVWPFLNCRVEGQPPKPQTIRFFLRLTGVCLLELTYAPERSEVDRQLFRITGGWLARVSNHYKGRFEFREVLSGRALIAAIHDFRPRLPWMIYNWTQAMVHLVVMRGFGRHLARIAREGLPEGSPPPPALTEATGGNARNSGETRWSDGTMTDGRRSGQSATRKEGTR